MKLIGSFFKLSFFLFLVSCIHIEDIEQDAEPKEVRGMTGGLIVSEELFVFNGQILNRKSYELLENPIGDHALAEETMDFKFQTLTLLSGGVIYTMGQNVRFDVQNLLGRGGRIETFPEGQTALFGQDGRDGGFIYVHANRAEGEVIFGLRGEQGGEGERGRAPDGALRGLDGHAVGFRCGPDAYVKPGSPGKRGYPGEKGKRGGDSGNIEIKIADEVSFNYRVDRSPGKGGRGGRGGAGGEGGWAPNICGMGGHAAAGPEGARGPVGESGINGKACITSRSSTTCI